MAADSLRYKAYELSNFTSLPQVQEHLSQEQIHHIEVVGRIFPFKTNNYVVEQLIDWSRVPSDPLFVLTFPQKEMLLPSHYRRMERALKEDASKDELAAVADSIRAELNPHPAGQLEHNVPHLEGVKLPGMQHKYQQTVLFFPSQAQTCHAYCSFCFRWPQFVGCQEQRFAMKEVDLLVSYLEANPQVTDVLFTGGDPLVMTLSLLAGYLEPLLEADLPHLRTIRIGSKSLAYWPYKYVSDKDSDKVLELFSRVTATGKQLAFMAHFNHPRELSTPVVAQAITRIRSTGAVLRSQSPLLEHINAEPETWAQKWRQEVELGVIPYYMFMARNTGAQHYFGVPLVRAWHIFQQAYQRVSGLARTVRGPSMSAGPGKVEVLGPTTANGERVLALRFIQGRNPHWVGRPFFASLDESAMWLDELQPAFGAREFFFEGELEEMYAKGVVSGALIEEEPEAAEREGHAPLVDHF